MKRLALLAFALLLLSQTAAAQITADTTGLHSKPLKPVAASLADDGLSNVITFETYRAIGQGGPVMICEIMPAYIRRNKKDSLFRFIQENTRWADPTGRLCIDGRVFVSFVVGPDGKVHRAKVLKGIHPAFNAEAMRVVQLLSGHFSPAICGGIARAHEMVVPISFFLNSISD